ncbi:hypothetical protein [Prosthecobacter sp.]|uniref:hypothetical protein n=1 Tax=Prosthecobacter sp. TaxID=1965333 RepID=UPI0037852D7B
MKFDLPETFFPNLADYTRFLLTLKETASTAPDGSWFAHLKKDGNKFVYTLEWNDGRFVCEHVRPFMATEANLELFNAGCKEMSQALQIYLETNDLEQVPKGPAFGILSCESPETLATVDAPSDQQEPPRNYFPVVSDAQLVRSYDGGPYKLELLTRVECRGIIQCDHMLVVFRKSENKLSYVVAAEANNLRTPDNNSGSHFLGCYPGSGHVNLGCSDDWGDLSRFEKEACRIVGDELGILITVAA